jgi:hypothetical protein
MKHGIKVICSMDSFSILGSKKFATKNNSWSGTCIYDKISIIILWRVCDHTFVSIEELKRIRIIYCIIS